MISNDAYQKITKDIAGARAKNRFIYEMYYGINEIFNSYLAEKDFFVIFDYACDIEKGINDCISFFQLKTTDKNYTLNKLITKPKNKEKSILQTLVDLKTDSCVDNLYIVSNSNISGCGESKIDFSNVESFSFDQLAESDKDKINSKITWPNGIPFFDKIHFIVSDLCLHTPSKSLLGFTAEFLNKIYPNAPSKPKYFMDTIVSMVMDKASYEYETYSLNDTINKKGINKADISNLLKDYYDNLINSLMPSIEYIQQCFLKLDIGVGMNIKIMNEYSALFSCGYIQPGIGKIISEIKLMYLSESYENLSIKDAILKVKEEYSGFGIYSSEPTKILLAIIATK